MTRGPANPVQTDHVIAHYRLLERIGRDHDTEIFRARDLRLDRDVAIKFLSARKEGDPLARERFRREARVASLVSHPHICAVHDSGEEGGRAYLVCELLEGEALDELAAGGPLPMERVLDLGIQLTDALAAVHARGIVHGNIKPSNVFVTAEGHVKLLEVGLMTAWWESLAGPARATHDSTPTASFERRHVVDADVESFHAYRSPEQISGDRLDHRSDIFSAGAVLYDIATGTRAFSGETTSEIAGAIAAGSPVPVRTRNPDVPDAVAAVIERALRRAPDDRYQSTSAMTADLRRARRRLESATSGAAVPAPARAGARTPLVWGAVAAAIVLLAAAGLLWPRTGTPASRQEILVGSVANGTNDPDFDGTLRQALTVHLGQSPFLDIASDERVRGILQMMGRSPDAPLTHEVAREACQRLSLNAMIEGSVSAVGRLTTVALVATDCATGETVARESVEVERKEDVLTAVGRLASELRSSLGESAASLQSHNVPIEEATTPSLEALKAYTAGVARRASGAELESIPFFERAIALDEGFALAYTMLSSVYGSLGETGRGEDYARLAYEHREYVSERERLFITYQYHDRVTGDQLKTREALEVWARAYPRDYRPSNALAVLLNRLGDYDRAIEAAQEAARRNPAHGFPLSNLAYALRGAGRYDEARAAIEKAIALRVETLPTRRLLYQLAEMKDDEATARAQLEWARPRAQGFDLTGARAQVLAFRGRMRDARAAYEETITLASRNGFPQIASGYAAIEALGEALYGARDRARARARSVPGDTVYAPRLRAAAALAFAGDPGEADATVRAISTARPDDTILHGIYLPIAEAAIQLARGRENAVVDTLRRATPYERGFVAALLPMYLRGEAMRRTGAHADAAAEYRAVLEHRGADPFSPVVPLAHLGLARALARAGDPAGSAAAYEEALAIWKNADPGFEPAEAARRESGALANGAGQ